MIDRANGDEPEPERTLWCKPGLKQLIQIDPEDTVNPDQDIVSTRQYTTGMTNNSHVAPPVGPLVSVYSDDGKVVGTITSERLNILSAASINMLNTEPEMMSTMGATCFAHKLALDIYKMKEQENALKENKHRRCTPDEYMLAFKDGLGVQCERFASPLDFQPQM